MQDAKEDSTWSFKSLKNKVRDLEKKACDWWLIYEEKLWAKRILVYLLFLVLWSVVFALIFNHFDLFQTEATSARYLLSALVQSQAAIIAIVVSLTLIAVQLTASAYSPRVIDIFKSPKKNPDLWILIGFYGFSIFYGLFLLKMAVGKESDFVNQTKIWSSFYPILSFEHGVSIAYWLGAFTFVILVPYIGNILDLLKPENIINRLTADITKKVFLSSKDPIQPIIDIVHGSIMKYDIATTRVGLEAVTERIIEIIETDDKNKITRSFCKHLERVGRLAISRGDEESAIEVIKNLEKFGKSLAEKRIVDAVNTVAWSLKLIETNALEKRAENVATTAVESLGEIGKTANEKGAVSAAIEVARHLALAAKDAMDQSVERTASKAVGYLGLVGIGIARDRAGGRITVVARFFYNEGIIAVDRGFVKLAESLARCLAKLTRFNEEIVRTELQQYGSKLEGRNRDSFQKFMGLYEQELEKRRVKQQI